MSKYPWWAFEDDYGTPTKITTDGKRFVVGGKTWKYRSVTAFTALADFIHGRDLSSFFDFAHGVKANTLRVFGMLSWADLYPQRIVGYYDWVDKFIKYCGANGFYVEFCIFASANEVMPSYSDQIDHFYKCTDVLKMHENVLISYSNENDLSVNNIDLGLFPAVPNTLHSSGSNGGDIDPPTPIRQFTEFHLGRNSEWPRKAKSAMEFADKYNVPCINNETNRPDIDGYIVSNFRDCGLVSGLLASGTNAHSEALKWCLVPTGAELECVTAILQADTEIDPDVFLGNYTRGGLDSCPLEHSDSETLRTFAMIKGDRAWAVRVQPKTPGGTAAPGWRITYENNHYFELERV